MAITNATRLSDFGSGIGTQGAVLHLENSTQRVGLGTSNPNSTATVGAVGSSGTSLFVYGDARCLGVITATSFDAGGSGGPIAGVNTTGFTTFNTVAFSGITTITNTTASTSGSTGALVVKGGVGVQKRLMVSDTTTSSSTTSGCAVFSGGIGVAKSIFVGEGISIAGTITYNDVTNIDSVGIVSARQGFKAGAATGVGATIYPDGAIHTIGIVTALQVHSGESFVARDTTVTLANSSNTVLQGVGAGVSIYGHVKIQSGLMRERVKISATALNSDKVINLNDGMVHYRSSAVGAASVKLNVISTAGINTDLAIGDAMAVTVLTVAGNTSHFVDQIRIDGVEATAGVTTYWAGGDVPTAGGGSNVDSYAFNILKTGNATYVVFANQVLASS